jgi:hypothetical protein
MKNMENALAKIEKCTNKIDKMIIFQNYMKTAPFEDYTKLFNYEKYNESDDEFN